MQLLWRKFLVIPWDQQYVTGVPSMRACAFGLVLFLRLLLLIFMISSLICSIVIVFADSLVGAVGGEVEFSSGCIH